MPRPDTSPACSPRPGTRSARERDRTIGQNSAPRPCYPQRVSNEPKTPHAIWETYASAWKETDPDRRRALLNASLDPHCRYRDPLASTEGFDALAAYMDQFQQQIPGGHFVTQRYWHHGDRCAAAWEMRGSNGDKLDEGVSFGEYNADGKLVTMTGFYDPPA